MAELLNFLCAVSATPSMAQVTAETHQ
jgi:hypothetical protein